MRKQYHFRDSPAGLLAWDVDQLVRLTQGLPVETVALDAIAELNEAYWYDVGDETPTCRSIAAHLRLVLDTDLTYPIILCPQGRVMDGMHRAVKALVEGQQTIQAYRLPVLPVPDHVGVDPDALPYD
ncbi:MAG: hypothetical protein ACN6O6_10650 [Pseudomonas sp.]|uniref:hypothetical protein n=1 Tax=Pseudomonas sp. TaxID=306 RepID=UPI003D0982EA